MSGKWDIKMFHVIYHKVQSKKKTPISVLFAEMLNSAHIYSINK